MATSLRAAKQEGILLLDKGRIHSHESENRRDPSGLLYC